MFLACAYISMACASGCSDLFSRLAARDNTSFSSSAELSTAQSVTSGCPLVIVPVLSNTTAVTLLKSSRLSASLIKTPFSAPLPTPTIIAVGVASPSAQGQAITSTPTNDTKPYESACEKPKYCVPTKSHKASETTESTSTIGTNTAEILSARAWMGARLP